MSCISLMVPKMVREINFLNGIKCNGMEEDGKEYIRMYHILSG